MIARRFLRFLGLLILLGLGLAAYGYSEAVRTPRVVRYRVEDVRWTAAPLTILLISDTHVAGPDMSPARLAGIVAQANALRPDIILLGGDYIARRFVSTHRYRVAEAIAPLAKLKAPLGVWAVLGNHDMRYGRTPDSIAALRASGIQLLRNRAAPVRDFWLLGYEDPQYGAAKPHATWEQVPAGVPAILLVHNPDLTLAPPNRAVLSLAGHTHGGQIAPPLLGPVVLTAEHRKLVRGLYRVNGRTVIVTSGVGASGVPLRINVPPEMVLITLVGDPKAAPLAPPRDFADEPAAVGQPASPARGGPETGQRTASP